MSVNSIGPTRDEQGNLSIKDGVVNSYLEMAQEDLDLAFENNPNLTKDQVKELQELYLDSYCTEEDFKNIKQVTILDNGNFFIEDFISFQYGVSITELNPKFSVHKGVLKQLQKYSYIITVI